MEGATLGKILERRIFGLPGMQNTGFTVPMRSGGQREYPISKRRAAEYFRDWAATNQKAHPTHVSDTGHRRVKSAPSGGIYSGAWGS